MNEEQRTLDRENNEGHEARVNGELQSPLCEARETGNFNLPHKVEYSQLHLVRLNNSNEPGEEGIGEARVVENGQTTEVQIEGIMNVLNRFVYHRDPQAIQNLRWELKELLRKHTAKELYPARAGKLHWTHREAKPDDPEEKSHENLGTFVIDANGNFWKWSCGWTLVDKAGRAKRSRAVTSQLFSHRWERVDRNGNIYNWQGFTKQRGRNEPVVLSHAQFAKVPKATRLELNTRQIMVSRPNGEWRRFVQDHTFGVPTLYFHKLYGHVRVLASDGVHAVIRNYYDHDQPQKECMFNSLTELKMSETSKSTDRRTAKRKPRETNGESKQLKVALTQDQINDLLS